MKQEKVKITQKEKKRLEKRLNDLKKKEARYMKSYIAAVKEGDERECDAFYLAKDLLEDASEQIIEIKALLKNSETVKNSELSGQKVGIGACVVLKIGDSKESEYTIVHPVEANPLENKISSESPIGKAIIGKAPGDSIEASVNETMLTLKIIAIR
ncbi:hypothetical protein GF357_01985 [Candidatus Dojkabacteria bacterium]|nr:hypothetical protein [Candidatus Dojkabacteria bacterium]